jgi:hypothetical protein
MRAHFQRSIRRELVSLNQGDSRDAKLFSQAGERFAFFHFVGAPPDALVRRYGRDIPFVNLPGSRRQIQDKLRVVGGCGPAQETWIQLDQLFHWAVNKLPYQTQVCGHAHYNLIGNERW